MFHLCSREAAAGNYALINRAVEPRRTHRRGITMTNANSTSPASLLATLAQRATFVLLAIAVIAIALLTRSWRDARAATAHLQATLDAQQHTIAAATQRESARDTQLAQTLAQIAAAKQRVKTPAEAAAALASALPPLPQPIQIETPSATPPAPKSAENSEASAAEAAGGTGGTNIHEWVSRAENSAASTIPTGSPAPPATLRIPQQDLKPLYNELEDCRACQASLAAVQSDLTDERTQLAATAAERDAALKSAKGGSFWTRLKRGAKWFAIGAATGTALGAIATHAAHP
jgi:chemotaxis protein histidine kinase CheA